MPISHAKTINTTIIPDWSGTVTVANSTGGTTTANASDMARPVDWNSNHVVSLTGSEVAPLFSFGTGLSSTTNAAGVTVGFAAPEFFNPFQMPNTNSTLSTQAVGSWYIDDVFCPNGLLPGRLNFFRTQNSAIFLNGVSISYNQTASVSKVASFRNCAAIYRRGDGNNSTRLESVWTGEAAISATYTAQWSSTAANSTNQGITAGLTVGFITQINTAGAYTTSQYTITGTTNQSSSSMSATIMDAALSSASSNKAFFTGSIMDMIPFNTTLPPDNYWFAHMFTTAHASTSAGKDMTGTMFFTSSVAQLHLLENVLTGFKQVGRSTVGNSSSCPVPFHGVVKTTSSNAFSTLATSDLIANVGRLYFNHIQDSQ